MPLLKTDGCTSQDYWSLPEGRRAELIDGRLYDMAPPSRFHQVIAFGIGRALDEFIEANDGRCNVYLAPFAVNLFNDETVFVEPDVYVVCDPGKQSDRGCEGAPDFVAEIVSPSSRRMGYITKIGVV